MTSEIILKPPINLDTGVIRPKGAWPGQFDVPANKFGSTPHVTVWVSPSYGETGKKYAKQVLHAAEIHYKKVAAFFKKPQLVPHADLIIAPQNYSAAYHYDGGSQIYANILPGYKWDWVSALFVAELEEVFAERAGNGWHGGASDHGEAMSRIVASSIVPGTFGSIDRVALWWNNGAPDYVSKMSYNYVNMKGDYGNDGIGCGYCFLRYLKKLKFKPDQILAINGNQPLEAVFQKLTKRKGGYKEMIKALRTYPPGNSAVNDNTVFK